MCKYDILDGDGAINRYFCTYTSEIAVVADVLDITERHQRQMSMRARENMQQKHDGNDGGDDDHDHEKAVQKALRRVFDRELYFASLDGDRDVVREALESGADPDGTNRNGFTPLHTAAFKGTKRKLWNILSAACV